MGLIDPNISYEEISDELLIREFNSPQKYKKKTLYALMAKRANSNSLIRNYLFELILDQAARQQTEMGIIKHAWLPVIFILEHSDDNAKLELKEILKQWSLREKESILAYVKGNKEYYNLLRDIC